LERVVIFVHCVNTELIFFNGKLDLVAVQYKVLLNKRSAEVPPYHHFFINNIIINNSMRTLMINIYHGDPFSCSEILRKLTCKMCQKERVALLRHSWSDGSNMINDCPEIWILLPST
jgi:hypothetical protein